MACIGASQQKTYVSTITVELKPPETSHTPERRDETMENKIKTSLEGNDEERTDVEPCKEITQKEEKPPPEDMEKTGVQNPGSDNRTKAATPKRRSCGPGPAVVFKDPLDKVQVCVGETAILHCSFSVSEPTASCWIHNRNEVVVDGGRFHTESSSTGSRLTISDIVPADVGSYTLYVRTRRGITHHTIVLGIRGPPERPASGPSVSQVTPDSLVLSWYGPSYDGGSQVTDYVVEMQTLGPEQSEGWRVLTTQCKDTTFRISSGLHPQGVYRFRVRACNVVGVSEPSEETDLIRMDMAATATAEPQEETLPSVNVVTDTTHKVKDLYNIHEKLGVGKFGQVFRLSHKETGRVCAGKFYRAIGSKDKEAARREIELMKELHHPKLVQCLGAFDSRSEIVLVMEYIAGGELFERIVDDQFEHTEPNSMQYMRQILEGVQYLHGKNVVHLDLKPENIVCLNAAGTLIKIIDFGLARKLEPGKPLMVMEGTPEFVAPEVINFEPVSLASDMWSIGVICYILLSGESPFQGETDAQTLALVTSASWEFDPEFDDITDEAKDFISKLLKKDKRARMSCEQALEHPWMDSTSVGITKSLNKAKIRRFLARQRWQKTGKAMLALKRMAHLSHRPDGSDSPTNRANGLSLGKDAEQAVLSLEEQLRSEPKFPQTLHDLTEPSGATVHMACLVRGYPDPEVLWFLNDEPLEESERVQIDYSEDGLCTLTLIQVRPEDSGIYRCRASNHLGEALCSARLTVAK